MYISVTSVKLRNIFKYFPLTYNSLWIVLELRKNSACKGFRSKGFGLLHYTMSLWDNEEAMKSFARQKAHSNAMKQSKILASEIRTVAFSGDSLPKWDEAKRRLEEGNVLRF